MSNRTRSKTHDQRIRRDTRLTRGAVLLDLILRQKGALAKAVKAEWPAWELWRFRRGHRRPGLEGSLAMKRLTRGRIQPEHWTELAEVSPPPEERAETPAPLSANGQG